tara:strand:+ start:26976 stop:27143 length:168 start_codon:yes stop_codon:yes gene_type:complete
MSCFLILIKNILYDKNAIGLELNLDWLNFSNTYVKKSEEIALDSIRIFLYSLLKC